MTLIANLCIGSAYVLLADILTSADPKHPLVKPLPYSPTHGPLSTRIDLEASLVPYGLTQKLIPLSENVVMAYANNVESARRYALKFRQVIGNDTPTPEMLNSTLPLPMNVDTIMLVRHGEGEQIITSKNCVEVDHTIYGAATVGGSGGEFFKKAILRPSQLFESETGQPPEKLDPLNALSALLSDLYTTDLYGNATVKGLFGGGYQLATALSSKTGVVLLSKWRAVCYAARISDKGDVEFTNPVLFEHSYVDDKFQIFRYDFGYTNLPLYTHIRPALVSTKELYKKITHDLNVTMVFIKLFHKGLTGRTNFPLRDPKASGLAISISNTEVSLDADQFLKTRAIPQCKLLASEIEAWLNQHAPRP